MILDFEDYVNKEKDKSPIKPTDCISLIFGLLAGGATYKLTKKDIKEKCEWYGMHYGLGARLVPWVLARTMANLTFNASNVVFDATINAINTILKGDEDGGSETRGYQTEQSQIKGDDDSED